MSATGSPTTRTRKRLAIASIGLAVWVAILLFGWALRPISDTVPLLVDPDGPVAQMSPGDRFDAVEAAPESVTFECTTLFDSNARDGAPPVAADGFVFERSPCEGPHFDARMALGLNALVVVAAVAVIGFVASRSGDDGEGDDGGGNGDGDGGPDRPPSQPTNRRIDRIPSHG